MCRWCKYDDLYFNPLPPCGGRRDTIKQTGAVGHFNPLPPCGGRPEGVGLKNKKESISIHSLRVEGDDRLHFARPERAQFQSTPSVWRETSDRLVNSLTDKFQSTPSVWRETSMSR